MEKAGPSTLLVTASRTGHNIEPSGMACSCSKRRNRMARWLTPCIFMLLATLLTALRIVAAEKPLPKQFYRPLVLEPPKIAAGDPVSNRCTDPPLPCYANNKDILKSQRTLLGIQDVIFYPIYNTNGGLPTPIPYVQQTQNSGFGNRVALNNSVLVGGNQSAAAGKTVSVRLFQGQGASPVLAQLSLSSDDRWLDVHIMSTQDTTSQDAYIDLGSRVPYDAVNPTIFAAAADFRLDGREEVVYAFHDSVCIAAAGDPTNPQTQLFIPGCVNLPANPDGTLQKARGVAVGTFGAGTSPRIAVLSSTAAQSGTSSPYLTLYNVDPNTFAITLASRTPLSASSPDLSGLAMASGHFTTTGYSQIAVAFSTANFSFEIVPVDFATDGSIKLPAPTSLGTNSKNYVAAAASGRFGLPQNPLDQLVLTQSATSPGNVQVGVLSFDNQFHASTPKLSSGVGCFLDLAVGNFDHMQPDPSNPGSTIRDPRDQVMVLTADFTNNSCSAITHLSVFNPAFAADGSLPAPPFGGNTFFPAQTFVSGIATASIAAVDTQGRSLVLGEPTVVTFEERQKISQILAMPPMHIDAIPANQSGAGSLQLYNFTAAPSGYKAAFDLSTKQTNSLSNKYTTTWSFASKETVGTKVNFGVCGDDGEDGDCVSTKTKDSAKQALNGSTATDNSESSSLQYQLDGETSDSDLILYSNSVLTDYIYPVIGRTVCPGGASSCDPSTRVPETVQFAGTDSVTKQAGAGIDLPWYQPVWMFGNVLSYPTNECQLELDSFGACGPAADSAGTLAELSAQLTLSTDFRGVETNTWANNKSSGSTTAFNQNYSFDLNTSVTAEENVLIESGEVKVSLDLSGSFGFQSLVDSRTETQASNGIQFTKTSIFQTQPSSLDWGYDVTSRIFGQKQPVTVPDTKAPNSADSPSSPDITSFGTMRTAFVVTPKGVLFNGGEGGWYGSGIDIGLNQPRHWYYTPGGSSANSTCLLASASNSQADCIGLSDNTEPNPFVDAFHIMRGFFVLPAAQSGSQPKSTGPQIERVKYNDSVILRVRVYNFSTVDTAGQTIHARFYAVPVSSGSALASSTFLGEATAGSIPHWGPDTNLTNWTYIDLPFTPGAQRINQDLAFWVVVWAQNADGSLAKDLTGHGLTAIPPQAIQWSDVKKFEEPYSNNVGFYNSLTYVLGESDALGATGNTSVEIVSAATERTPIHLGDSSPLTIRAQTGPAPIHMGINFKFYEGDPHLGGTLIGLRRLPYLRAGETYELAVNYRPKTVGRHDIFVSAGEGTKFQHSVQLRTVTVVPGTGNANNGPTKSRKSSESTEETPRGKGADH